MTDTIQHLTYDDFGRVIRNDRGGRKADMSCAYDRLHGWTTGVKSGGGFEQKLYRETGALLLKNGKAGMYQFQGGYYSFNSNGVLDGCHYYIQDYQGPRSIKEGLMILRELRACLARSAGEQVEPLGESPDRTYGLDLYDFEARQYDAITPWFTGIDPLAEKYYWISPYVYCAGDPVNLIDPTGMYLVDFVGHISDDGNRNVLTSVDGSTKKTNKSQGEVLDQLIDSQDGNKDKQGKSTKATAKSNISKGSAVSLFRFLAHHSKVEWSLTSFKSGSFGFGTEFQEKSTVSPIVDWADIKWQVHSHPFTMETSQADQNFAWNAVWKPWTGTPQKNVAPFLFIYHVPTQTMVQYSWKRYSKTGRWEFPGQDASSEEDAEGIKDAVGIISVIDKTNSDL